VEFRLLGPLELIDGGGPAIELPAGKSRTLLALLLLEAGRVVSVDRIIDALWGERPPATAAKVVQGHVSRLSDVVYQQLPADARLRGDAIAPSA
jgi:DNA-binding SARP family transcriptional activator